MKRLRLAAVATLGIPVVIAGMWIARPIPPAMLSRDGALGVTIEDRHGVSLRSTRAEDGSDARWVPYDRVDPDLINAFVAVEDKRFWDHPGIDVLATGRALRANLRAGKTVSGASTITMQLARLVHPASRSWTGKVTQALWALRLEARLSKQQIMEQYLNRVHLGEGTVGIGAATALYFGASASEVSIGQAATLAGLAHAPSRDNPHASPLRARRRQAVALARMRRLGFATGDDIARVRDESFASAGRVAPFVAPHFTTRVLAWTADDEALGEHGRVRTSLDVELQRALEAEVRHTVDVLRDRHVEHAAAVVLDNATGEVLAWVGSPDFWASKDGQTDMVVSARQPGSALKPFLYAVALDRGYTAASVLPDIPKSYATATMPYQPRNYDRRFRGPVRAREALASSYNVPAVELASALGASTLLRTLRLAGFESLRRDAEYYGLGLSLGNGDVTLIELANAYRALANGGEWRPWTWHLTRPGGASNRAEPGESRRVASPAASAIVVDILRDPAARIPGFGVSTPFDFPFPVAVKTGTSRHFTDNWAVGTTRAFTVAVWAGNFSGRAMEGVSGITGAGPLLHRAVMAVARVIPPGVLATPAEAGAVSAPVCRLSGLRATSECAQLTEWFVPGTAPEREDDWERGGFVRLPDEYAEWSRQGLRPAADEAGRAFAAARTRVNASTGTVASNRSGADSSAARGAQFRIVSPLDGDRYSIPVGIESRYASLALRAAGPGAEQVRWSVDGNVYARDRWTLAPGTHEIRAISARGDTARVSVVVQ